ncbi:pyridine nucleotide-disulfide oxidoreductase AMID-like protein [Eremomyces bilateralis CBS 781.70]|uniref:Pyridine nucleotide-disulfide oxidoreductase AMID-like protein n=1 Tax=Eremomyces bilateralis CBS 781.70 TaxID=1392243 RepID=A0A6G1GFG0_9PEZI|nr:pyridine nucleotide-disulfide oxidoreductase AMID-like protein [Eremomyces bilateralis CBS 781.70]KAF1816808.1 pyridine nucleotide-disulfide oxidoreductase AMID-like protein [Eremomyces bilateralis CBS 781.70]
MAVANLARTRILVAGGSYGGLAAALNLLDMSQGRKARSAPTDRPASDRPALPVQITIVDERDGFFHLIGSPLALATEEYARKAWVPFSEIPALKHTDVSFLQGTVTSIDPNTRTATISRTDSNEHTQHDYDYLVAASGLRRVWPTVPQALKKKKWLVEADGHIQSIKEAKERVVVIGGGAVGIEMAAELQLVHPQVRVTLVHSRDRLLSSEELPDEMAEKTKELLVEGGVEVILGHRVKGSEPVSTNDGTTLYDVTFTDGTHMRASHVISAISRPMPTSSYIPAGALNDEGLVKVNSRLEFTGDIPNNTSHFAAGDMIAWSGIKRCGAAMFAGAISASNIYQQMVQKHNGTEPKFDELPPIPPMIALAVGATAVAYHPDTGLKYGDEVMQNFFQDDLGFNICYNIMGLATDPYKGPEVEKSVA